MGTQYSHLGDHERETISLMLAAGASLRRIATQLKRAAGTISREIKRNRCAAGRYRVVQAANKAKARAHKPRRRAKLSNPRLAQLVRTRLKHRHSPEQISRSLRALYPGQQSSNVSHETIYKALYVLPCGELRRELTAFLRQGKRQRGKARPGSPGGAIVNALSIDQRPLFIQAREQVGHWEGDLIKGKNNRSALITLVERRTRYLMLIATPDCTAYTVRKAIETRLSRLSMPLRRSLTYDRGSEMAEHVILSKRIKIEVYFAHPHSPWERATNENTNGLLRQYFPKGMDLSELTAYQINKVQRELNDRPRRILNWRTPAELFRQFVQSETVALGT